MVQNRVRKLVSLTVTENCNLACIYCYEGYKSPKVMTFATAIHITEQYLNSTSTAYDECEIDLFGGEPLLNFPLIKELCEYVWSRRWNKPYIFFASTNGTLVHGEIQEWFLKNRERFYLGLSLDGTPKMQDCNRSNSYSRIDVPFFQATWPDSLVKMTISQHTLPNLAEGVIYLHSLGFQVHSNPAYGIDWTDPNNTVILSRELKKLVDYYLEHPEVKPCTLLDMKIEYQGYVEKKWCGVGIEMAVFDADGRQYPCHGFLPVSIGQEKADASLSIDFSQIENLVDPNCKDCILYNICPTCYGSNYSSTGNIASRNLEQCNFSKVRAMACSYFEAKKILADTTHSSIDEKYLNLVDSIVKIQNQITLPG